MSSLVSRLTPGRLIIFIAFIAVFVIALLPALDPDTFWHLRAGQWQVEHRAILKTDYFSTTQYGTNWLNAYWISQIVLYGIYAILGPTGLSLYTALVATAGMAVVYKTCHGDDLTNAVALLFGAFTGQIFWSARPHIHSFLLTAVVYYLLWLYHHQREDHLWWIPGIMVLWANLHPGFAQGFILLALAMVAEGARWLEGRIAWRRAGAGNEADTLPTVKPVLRLTIIGLVSAAALLVNPFGLSLILHPFRTVAMESIQTAIVEWQSPDFHQPQVLPGLFLLLATVAALGLSRQRITWPDLAYLGGTLYLALTAVRNMPLFAIAATPILASHLYGWLTEMGYRLNWQRPPNRMQTALNAALLAAVLVGATAYVYRILDTPFVQSVERNNYPVAAMQYVAENDWSGPLFNDYGWGGWLIWNWPDYPVFVDGRTDLYDYAGLLVVYQTIANARPGWEEELDQYGIRLVVIPPSVPLAGALERNEAWEQVYADGVAVVFARR